MAAGSASAAAAAKLQLCGSLAGPICPWVWIACRREPSASAWSTPAVDSPTRTGEVGLQRLFSSSFQESLAGRITSIVVILAGCFAILIHYLKEQPDFFVVIVTSFVMCFLMPFLILFLAWVRVGKPNAVTPGLMGSLFVSGGVLGVFFAFTFESMEEAAWAVLSPTCNGRNAVLFPGCAPRLALIWILTPGLIEETGKALWLFFQLRRSRAQVPTKCLGCCPAKHSWDCGCWYLLAPTPYHVILCAFSAGAGFECLENIKYVFSNFGTMQHLSSPRGPAKMIEVALSRCLTSGMHMLWTGLIGYGLSMRMFLPAAERPSLPAVILPSIILHGLFDFSLFATQAAQAPGSRHYLTKEDVASDTLFFLSLFLFTVFGTCFPMCCLTGLRCRGGCSCCCAPGFWERRYTKAEVLVGEPVAGSVLRQPLMHGAS